MALAAIVDGYLEVWLYFKATRSPGRLMKIMGSGIAAPRKDEPFIINFAMAAVVGARNSDPLMALFWVTVANEHGFAMVVVVLLIVLDSGDLDI